MDERIDEILKDDFGLESFYDWQREIIQSIINGQNTFVIMPTWWWKSLTYQLPGMYLKWLVIVISPLISLMKDQVDKLDKLWIRAEFINSTKTYWEIMAILDEIRTKNTLHAIKYLYIAPERLNSIQFMKALANTKISLLAIDEAHCVSQWGHDFRPSYLKINHLIYHLKLKENKVPVVALTATATKKVREDVVERLEVKDFKVFIKGFNRKNIVIIVREISKRDEKLNKVQEILKKIEWVGIIYCSSIKKVGEVYEHLRESGVSVGKYTWEMAVKSRENTQNKFMAGELKVIVATNAFGMWIDKKDVRIVIHYNLPWSIENYYQEAWRAGRDGKKSFSVVLASYGDVKIQEFFIENSNPPQKEILDFYNYLFITYKSGEWSSEQILKTQAAMASEAWISSDMKVWSILRLFEKYWILKRWVDSESIQWFRGRGITLMQNKKMHSELEIDWEKQWLLEKESHYKLEQIKKLLFYPSCRRKFILSYFGDEIDLEGMKDGCGGCDYCFDMKKLDGNIEAAVPLSTFGIVLDTVWKFDGLYGSNMIIDLLYWSSNKKIIQYDLDSHKRHWVLSSYHREIISLVFKGLEEHWYLKKTTWDYPKILVTEKWKKAIWDETIIKKDFDTLQKIIHIWMSKIKPKRASSLKPQQRSVISGVKVDTFKETLRLIQEWLSIEQIVEERWLKHQTIWNHIVKLYEKWDILMADILRFTDKNKVACVKQTIQKYFPNGVEKLRELKEKTDNLNENITYLDINIAISMISKWDL